MPKRELLEYIQKKQREGKTQDEIIYKLTSHGWPLAEVHEGFNYLTILNSPEPVHSSSVYEPTRVTNTEAPMQSRSTHWFFEPKIGLGIVAVLLSAIMATLFSITNHISTFSAQITYISFGLCIVAGLLGGLITNLTSRILRVEGRSFAKSLVYYNATSFLTALLATLVYAGAPTAFRIVVPVFGAIFGVIFFWYYYRTTVLKAIGSFVLSLVFGVIVSGILFFLMMFIAGAVFLHFLPSLHSF